MSSFLFVGDDLALDLLNTEVFKRGRRVDLLASPADLDAWWTAAQRHHNMRSNAPRSNDLDLMRIRELRARLRNAVEAVIAHADIDEPSIIVLNEILRAAHPTVRRDGAEYVLDVADDSPHDPAVMLALSGARLITEADHHRLHQCENSDCILFFYDRTKSGTRRWCDTRCFDRARAKARRENAT